MWFRNELSSLAEVSLYREISKFKKGYHPRPYEAKDQNFVLLADLHSILKMYKIHSCHVLSASRVSYVRRIVMRTAQLHVSEPRAFEIEMGAGK